MKSNIFSIGTAVPEFRISQMEVGSLMTQILPLKKNEKEKLIRLYQSSGIKYRHSVIEDFSLSPKQFKFFPYAAMQPFPGTRERMEVYKKNALPLALKAVEDCFSGINLDKKEITHLIVISCTGIYAPGLDIELIESLGLHSSTQRTGVNFMGCYAAFNGMKVADHICRANPGAKVLMVSLELCTLHFNPHTDIENILVNTLFSDGAAAILVQSEQHTGLGLEIEKFHCALAPESKNEMTWDIDNHGFDMKLSPEVPLIIRQGIEKLCLDLLQKEQFDQDNIDIYAIHPGGRKILEVIEEKLKIPKEKNWAAYQVLENFGNMSSPTILFVLKAIWEKLRQIDHEKKILSFAFGPGLTLESMLLKVNNA
ncbi:MAG: type III polyketide synthase [Cyclobacteriaceae bacterium]